MEMSRIPSRLGNGVPAALNTQSVIGLLYGLDPGSNLCGQSSTEKENMMVTEPPHEKTGFLLIRKKSRRSADQRLWFCYSDSTIPLLVTAKRVTCIKSQK